MKKVISLIRMCKIALAGTAFVETLKMGTNASFPPYEYYDDETGAIVSVDAEVAAAIQELERKMAGNGRVLIRPSGTEPLVRVMLEGNDLAVIQPLAEELAALIERRLGA